MPDEGEVLGLLALLLLHGSRQRARVAPSPVVELNRAVAIAMAGDVDAGLEQLDAITAACRLGQYHLLEAARGELLLLASRPEVAATAFAAALELPSNEAERRHLQRRLDHAGKRAGRA